MDVMMSGRGGSAAVAGVVLGVDTHLDLHVAVALDQLGRRLGELTVPTRPRRVTKASSLGRRVSAPCGVPV
jgi:hypothetical protein